MRHLAYNIQRQDQIAQIAVQRSMHTHGLDVSKDSCGLIRMCCCKIETSHRYLSNDEMTGGKVS
jgi:hypothetical protein